MYARHTYAECLGGAREYGEHIFGVRRVNHWGKCTVPDICARARAGERDCANFDKITDIDMRVWGTLWMMCVPIRPAGARKENGLWLRMVGWRPLRIVLQHVMRVCLIRLRYYHNTFEIDYFIGHGLRTVPRRSERICHTGVRCWQLFRAGINHITHSHSLYFARTSI